MTFDSTNWKVMIKGDEWYKNADARLAGGAGGFPCSWEMCGV